MLARWHTRESIISVVVHTDGYFVVKGPEKSNPEYGNGAEDEIISNGRSPISGKVVRELNLKHVTQFPINFRNNSREEITQKLLLKAATHS